MDRLRDLKENKEIYDALCKGGPRNPQTPVTVPQVDPALQQKLALDAALAALLLALARLLPWLLPLAF